MEKGQTNLDRVKLWLSGYKTLGGVKTRLVLPTSRTKGKEVYLYVLVFNKTVEVWSNHLTSYKPLLTHPGETCKDVEGRLYINKVLFSVLVETLTLDSLNDWKRVDSDVPWKYTGLSYGSHLSRNITIVSDGVVVVSTVEVPLDSSRPSYRKPVSRLSHQP